MTKQNNTSNSEKTLAFLKNRCIMPSIKQFLLSWGANAPFGVNVKGSSYNWFEEIPSITPDLGT